VRESISTVPSGLFTSCAIPAASCPMLASFSDCMSASWVLASRSFETAKSLQAILSCSIV